MLSYCDALKRIAAEVQPLPPTRMPLAEARNLVLAKSVEARYPNPRTTQSAMDGFALRSTDTANATAGEPARLRLIGAAAAGAPYTGAVEPRTAVRISTGAAIPEGCDAVAPQEHVTLENGAIVLTEPAPSGANIRRAGEEYSEGTPLLPRGTALTPAVVGLLASQGMAEISVYPRPRAAVLTTGDELTPLGEPLKGDRIYNSNSPMLCAALAEAGLTGVTSVHCPDDPDRMRRLVAELLDAHDVLITAGGVSVGSRDHVRESAEAAGVETVFWRVAMKPGKPTYFGQRAESGAGRRACVFGLPGNPMACALGFLVFVAPALRRLAGLVTIAPPETRVRLAAAIPGKREGRTEFIPAKLRTTSNGLMEAEPVAQTGSHMLSGLAQAPGFIRLDPEEGPPQAGQPAIFVHEAYRLVPGPAL